MTDRLTPTQQEIYDIMAKTIRDYAHEAIELKKELETLKTELAELRELETLKTELAELRESREKSLSKTLLILANLKQKMFNVLTDEYAEIYNCKTT